MLKLGLVELHLLEAHAAEEPASTVSLPASKYRGSYLIGTICVFINNGVWILFPLVLRHAVDGLHTGVTRAETC